MVEKEKREKYYFEDPNATRPLTGLERLGLRVYHASMEFSGPDQSMRSQHARDSFEKVIDDISEGRSFSHPIREERLLAYSEHDSEIHGAENVPQNGAFVIVSNHFNQGIHKGISQVPVMAHAVSQCIPDGDERKFIPVIEGQKDLVQKAQKNVGLNSLYPRIGNFGSQSIQSSMEKILGPADRVASQVLFNTSVVFGMIPTQTHSREITKVFRNGDVLILFPTGKDEYELHQVDPMAGKLAELAGAMKVPLLPVGFWFDKKEKIYQVNIGQPFIITRNKANPNSNGQNADKIGVRIAQLLPGDMRGYYNDLSPEQPV